MNKEELANQAALFELAALLETQCPGLELMFHVPNEGKRSVYSGAELKRAGLKKGVPDVMLPVARKGYHGLAIELKAGKNKPTEDQKKWLRGLAGEGWLCYVCWGYEAAAAVLGDYMDIKISLLGSPQKTERWGKDGAL